ncbi:hypothetical protein [Streptomyces sp. NBC_01465]|uniref:hypothetical protein n=1 Tax=Streptomyces sp. NBC_01465 TaxID=2903878 RepID=UPI002E344CFD|nr:hypothetical protein [Streptomyces sp. NBC_01465]
MTTDTSTPLRAHCTAAADGSITFVLADDAHATALVLKHRKTGERLRLELAPDAVLAAKTPLAPGRWDVFADCGEYGSRRVESGIRDLSTLVDRTPEPASAPVAVRIPYPAKGGALAVRSWLRAPHAEAGAIVFAERGMTVEGRLYGTSLGPGAVVEARLRGTPGTVHHEPATGESGAFAFTLPYGPLAAVGVPKDTYWDLWLLPSGERQGAVRIARILDDIAERKGIYVYPAGPADAEGRVTAVPYYTVDNDLSLRLDPVSAPRVPGPR